MVSRPLSVVRGSLPSDPVGRSRCLAAGAVPDGPKTVCTTEPIKMLGSSSRVRIDGRLTTDNGRLTTDRDEDGDAPSSSRPAAASTLPVAGVGPVSMIVGSDPVIAVATTRARGCSPRSSPACSLPTRTSAAPSTIPRSSRRCARG